uniref:Uncharacterized protein n=1 Tax=Caudovirales sp. ctkvU4 TaxID=2826783 RepID=A0A8S5QR00_9CAUD|nr:MAG TPA: hypothetical protein [Caudovirales sp. ctkvU4]
MCEILIGAFSTLIGALIGGACSYFGNKAGSQENFRQAKRLEILKLKEQLNYLLDIYEVSLNFLDDRNPVDKLIWQENTFILYKDYKTGLLISDLSVVEKQRVLKWFSTWQILIKRFEEKYNAEGYHKIVGATLLEKYKQESEDLKTLYPEIKCIADRL